MTKSNKQQSLTQRRKTFRQMCEQRDAMIVPGAGNALTARIIEDTGFDVMYITGAGIANTDLGVPGRRAGYAHGIGLNGVCNFTNYRQASNR